MDSFGTQSEIGEAYDELTGVIEKLEGYQDLEGDLRTTETGYDMIPLDSEAYLKLPEETIGRSVGAKAQNYDILDLETGEHYHLVEGTKLQNIEVFAGKGVKAEYRKAEWYASKYGGLAEEWQHVKGIGTVQTPDGQFKAELHWTQRIGYEKIDMFIKRWLE